MYELCINIQTRKNIYFAIYKPFLFVAHPQELQSSSSLLPANAADVCRSIIPIPTQALTHPIFSFSPFPNCCSPLVFVIADMVLCCLDYIGAHPIQAVQSFNTLLCLCNMNHSKGRALLER